MRYNEIAWKLKTYQKKKKKWEKQRKNNDFIFTPPEVAFCTFFDIHTHRLIDEYMKSDEMKKKKKRPTKDEVDEKDEMSREKKRKCSARWQWRWNHRTQKH